MHLRRQQRFTSVIGAVLTILSTAMIYLLQKE
jgi:hypothetical protein